MSQVATFNETLAAFFKRRPLEWIDGKRLAQVAGGYAWRSRVSDLRRAPFHMTIENRQRRITEYIQEVPPDIGLGALLSVGTHSFTISEYRFVPAAQEDRDATVADAGAPAELPAPIEPSEPQAH